MKFSFLCLLLLLGNFSTEATTYYLSNGGNDSLDGMSKTTAWSSLEKLKASMAFLHSGDSILLERCSIFRGELIIPKSGLYIGSYHQGENPIVSGSIILKKWSLVQPNIWMSECTDCAEATGNLFIDGTAQPLGRYPNTGYLSFTRASHSESTITDTLLSFNNYYWNNAELVVRSSRWTLDKLPISVYQNKTFHTSSLPSYPLNKGYGYFIQKHISTLDHPGEWFFEEATKRLYLYVDKNVNPVNYLIEVSVLEVGLEAKDVHNILVENLTFQHQRTTGIRIQNSKAVLLNKLEILHSANNGMAIKGNQDVCVENCSVIGSNNNGVEWTGNTKGVFRNNLISHTGIYAGRGQSGNGTYIGLRMYSNNVDTGANRVENNTIESTGYSGIDFRTGNTTIKNNFISNFCLVKDDGGGIYTWSNTLAGNSLTGNTITQGVGSGEGTNQQDKLYAYGIYIDDRSSGLNLTGNTISGCATAGIFIHNSKVINITHNTAHSNGTSINNMERGQFYIRLDTLGKFAGNMNLDLLVSENNWIAENEALYGVFLSASRKKDLDKLGAFTQNKFNAMNPHYSVTELYRDNSICSIPNEYTLSDWQSASHYEKGSTYKVPPFNTANGKRATNMITNGSMTTNLKGWSVWPEKSLLLHQKADAPGKPSLNVIRSEENKEVLLYHGGISLVMGKLYRLSFSAKSSEITTLEFVPLMEKSPWQALGDYRCFSMDSSMKAFTYYFRPTVSQTHARVNFKSSTTFWIENVTLYEVNELH